MNTKSLIFGFVIAASLCGTAAADLVINGHLEASAYSPGSTVVIVSPNAGAITGWQVHGSGATTGSWNSVYIYDGDIGVNPPAYMPSSYDTCAPGSGFLTGGIASCANPDGIGHFINLDGDPDFPAAISQSIVGLEFGKQYRLTFSWAAVQRNDRTGRSSDEYLTVSLGDQVFTTTNYFPGTPSPTCTTCLPSEGFSGWITTNYDFTWDGAGTLLTFLAHGNPRGLPPSVNLDRISLNALAVPEPSTSILLMAGGFGLVMSFAKRRRSQWAGC